MCDFFTFLCTELVLLETPRYLLKILIKFLFLEIFLGETDEKIATTFFPGLLTGSRLK